MPHSMQTQDKPHIGDIDVIVSLDHSPELVELEKSRTSPNHITQRPACFAPEIC